MGSTVAPAGTGSPGFTLIETMVAMAVLAGGLLALAQVFTLGFTTLAGAGSHIVAREKATEAIESVYTARDTQTLTWAQVHNVGDGGVFLEGEQDMTEAGADGLVNTADDGDIEVITKPGPDGEFGNGDDTEEELRQFSRQIEITDVSPNLRRIRVTIRYVVGGGRRQYVVESLISAFA